MIPVPLLNPKFATALAAISCELRVRGTGGELAPSMASETVLETEGLTKEFAGFVAVRDVNLRVERGTIHALIGPNGAGKTTCFNLLTKFLSPTHGRIMYKGREITDSRPADVARLGLVRSFQIDRKSTRLNSSHVAISYADFC